MGLSFTQLVDEFVLGFVLGLMFLLAFHAFANAFLHVVDRGEFGAEFLGEVVIQLGQVLLLHAADFYPVVEALAGQAVVGEVVGVLHDEGTLIAGVGTAQVFGELGNGILTADFDHYVVHGDRLLAFAFTLRRAFESHLGESRRPVWDVLQSAV